MTSFDKLASGDNPPNEINVVVEIPSGSSVKYEVDRETGNVFVDRFLYTATHYPFNYGFVPRTREEDGDPIDVVVLTQLSVVPMTIIRSRPLGMLVTEDKKGRDVKIVARAVRQDRSLLRRGRRRVATAPVYEEPDRDLLQTVQGTRADKVREDSRLGR